MQRLSSEIVTVDQALRQAATALRDVSETPMLDARVLMRAVLDCDETGLIVEGPTTLSGQANERFSALLARRLANEPVSRILGEREFWGLMFEIASAVLDPRPDTELLVETALDIVKDIETPIICDVGTGSGAIAIALLTERPDMCAIATDISIDALAVASRNADRHGVADRFQSVQTRWLSGVKQAFNLIVSNPPYIPSGEIKTLAPDVRDHDPAMALDGGATGLEAYRAILAGLEDEELSRTAVLFEVGAGQASDVEHLIREHAGTSDGTFVKRRDLAGLERVVGWIPHARG